MPPNLTARRGCAIAAVLFALSLPDGATAQRLAPDFAQPVVVFEYTTHPSSLTAALAFGHPEDYRWEGALVGGLGMGLFGAALSLSFCGADDTGQPPNCVLPTLGGILVGATVGVPVGGIVGSVIKKTKKD